MAHHTDSCLGYPLCFRAVVPAPDGPVPTAPFWDGAKREHRGKYPLQLSQHAPVHDPQQPEGRGGCHRKLKDRVSKTRRHMEASSGNVRYNKSRIVPTLLEAQVESCYGSRGVSCFGRTLIACTFIHYWEFKFTNTPEQVSAQCQETRNN